MKIAIVFDKMTYGGISRVGIEYIKVLCDLHHEIDVYILNKNVQDIINEIPESCNIKICNFPQWICPDYYWRLAIKNKYAKYIVSVVYFVFKMLFQIIKLFYKKNKSYDLAISFSGHINDLTYTTSNIIKSKKKLAWAHGGIYSYLLISPGFGYLYKKIQNIVTLSSENEYETLLYNKHLKLNTSKIYNPISIKNRTINKEKIEELTIKYGDYLLMVGRFSSQKDQKTVVDAIEYLKEQYGFTNKLLFIGEGDTLDEVKKYIISKKLDNQIFCLGNKSDVENYYLAAKLFIHSSPVEGLPTVILEALAFGLPVVATDSPPGVREILGNNEFGIVCENKNYKSMADSINLLMNNDELYHRYSVKGLSRIEDFSVEKIKIQLQNLIDSI